MPQPSPTNDQVAACLKSCSDACDDWGAWSALSPAVDTVCEGDPLTQSQSRTRTCKATCPEVQCQKTDKKEVEVVGTKDCTSEQPPTCLNSCPDACEDYGEWSALSPSTDTVCEGDPLTQSQSRTRTCKDTCPNVQCQKTETKEVEVDGTLVIDCKAACDKDISWDPDWPSKTAAEICKGETETQTREGTFKCPRDECKKCPTDTKETRPLVGTKVSPCQQPHCTAWQAVTGVWSWKPARDSECSEGKRLHTLTMERTCNLPCPDPDDPCKTSKEDTKCVAPPEKKVVKTETNPPTVVQPPVTVVQCNQCDKGCDEQWGEWEAWQEVGDRCPDTIDFTTKLLKEETDNRLRKRACNNNLCADAVCFTSNSETRTKPCTCPEGKVLDADGMCVCDASKNKYKKGNNCETCPNGYDFKLVDGVWTCEPTPCDECCDVDWSEPVSDWGNPTVSISEQASNVCHNDTFIPDLTYTRDCSPCKGITCDETRSEKGDETKGTKDPNCNDNCSWGAWSGRPATKTCPETTQVGNDQPSLTWSETRARTCDNDCSRRKCTLTGNKTESITCDCKGTGQIAASGMCVCDEGNRYYRTDNTCTLCPVALTNGQCVCPEGKELTNGECVAKPSEEEIEDVSIVEPVYETCEEGKGCSKWNMDEWTWSLTKEGKCEDPASMDKPKLAAQKEERTRKRECTNLKAGLVCFTSNTETRTTECEWCQGTGMDIFAKGTEHEGEELTEDTCLCRGDLGYYEKDGECVECEDGESLVKKNGTYMCEKSCNHPDVCGAWPDIDPDNWTPKASEKCQGEEFIPEQTLTRTCPVDRAECDETKPVEDDKAVGTKTVKCDRDCKSWGNYGDWTTDETCPTSTALGSVPSITETKTRTRTCPQELCGTTCATSQTETRPRSCSCTGEGQTKEYMGNTCICDKTKNYYQQGNACVQCTGAGRKLVGGKCECDSDNNYYAVNGNDCELCADSDRVNNQNGGWECETEKPVPIDIVTPEFNETCAEGCTWDDWSDWEAQKDCPAKSSFIPPDKDTIKSRSRVAKCENLKAGLECFTANTETETCEWCKGEGQKLDGGTCVCDMNSNYYRATNTCVLCPLGKIVNSAHNGCECPGKCDELKVFNDVCECVCPQTQEYKNSCVAGFDENTCECNKLLSVTQDINISIYKGCFFDSNSPLHLPSGYDNDRGLQRALGNNHKWKFEQCFNEDIDEYNEAVNAIDGNKGNVQDVIQKLYDCAKDEGESNFIRALTEPAYRNCTSSDPSGDITVTITITP